MEYNNSKFYNTKDKILLATNYRGGYFYDPVTSIVENIVYKNSGYGNCVIGNIKYFNRLIKKPGQDYSITKKGKSILNNMGV